jgi:hypothetical protein
MILKAAALPQPFCDFVAGGINQVYAFLSTDGLTFAACAEK